MPLLEIESRSNITATVIFEGSNAKQVNAYAAFVKGSANEVINKALEYVFSKDKDFQKFFETTPDAMPAKPLVVHGPKGPRATKKDETPGHSNGNGNHAVAGK